MPTAGVAEALSSALPSARLLPFKVDVRYPCRHFFLALAVFGVAALPVGVGSAAEPANASSAAGAEAVAATEGRAVPRTSRQEDPPPDDEEPVASVEVEIEGLDDDLRENVRALLSIVQYGDEEAEGRHPERRIRSLHAQAPEEIERALQPFGYFRPELETRLESPTPERDQWLAVYRVEPGPRVELDRVQVELRGDGRDDPRFRSIVDAFPLEVGDPFRQPPYTELKNELSAYAAGHGYFDAELLRHEIRVELDPYRASIDLVYDTGPRYRFGEVTFHPELLRRQFLQRYVHFEEGAPFELERVFDLRQALGATPYFLSVDVDPRPEEGAELAVPIRVDLVPARERQWRLGGGYGTDTGPRARVNFEWRRVNRRGHTAQADLIASFVEQHLTLQYRVPKADPRTDALIYEVGYRTLDTDVAESDTALAGASYTRAHGRWRETFSLQYRHSDFEVGIDEGTVDLLVPTAHWLLVDAEDRLYADDGWRYEIRTRGSWDGLIADASFLQLEGTAVTYRSLAPDLRVIGRLTAGYNLTDDFRSLPPEFRFFAGGDRSVRGFDYQEIGELDEEGNVIGGETLLEGSLELESLFLDFENLGQAGAALFWDVGSAADSFGDDLHHGVGLGLRWLSPVGLVRADVAWGVSEDDPPVRFHLTIGPDL